MELLLPTCTFNSWAVTDLRDSLVGRLLKADSRTNALKLYFYAITLAGWREIRSAVKTWKQRKQGRVVTVYVGTDHAITDPEAMDLMQHDGIDVCLMQTYRGVFHPKVVWLSGDGSNVIWVGSNNLTRDGLLHNIEFAVVVDAKEAAPGLTQWAAEVADGSTPLSPELLRSYAKERERFERKRAAAHDTTFTWSRKQEPPKKVKDSPVRIGDLIVEIMPEETRGGTQIQIPMAAAGRFFGLHEVGETTTIRLQPKGSTEYRSLVVTVFTNNTVRLSVNELEYRDRPCVMVFRKSGANRITFEIVPESIFPTRYRELLSKCEHQTRAGSRRWTIV